MSPSRRNLLFVGAVVLALVIAGWLLRARPTGTEGAAPDTTASPTVAVSTTPSPSPSASPSGSGSPSASSSTSTSPTATPIKTVAFVGDSFTAGVGASAPGKRWTTLVAAAHRWTEHNFGHPQTGYTSVGTVGPCATAGDCPNYLTQVPAVVAAAPDLIILTGGGNDLGLDQATVRADVDATLAGLRTGLPNATIVVVNPWWDMRPAPENLAVLTENLKAAAAAAGVTWADTGQPIVGKVDRVTSDGLQANDSGHAAMAEVIESALKLAGIAG